MHYEEMWLKNHKVNNNEIKAYATAIYSSPGNKVMEHAVWELQLGLEQMFSVKVETKSYDQWEGKKAIILLLQEDAGRDKESFTIKVEETKIIIEAIEEVGILYGVFHLLRMIACDNISIGQVVEEEPDNPHRMLNHWDNMDGSIERGYAGESFFFQKNKVIVDDRIREYARLMASITINEIVVNNVNVKDAATYLITDRYMEQVKQLAEIFSEYGIKLYLSLNFAAPMELGDLDSADPLNQEVISWWEKKCKEVFEKIPDFGGFLVKADSEGRPGPFTYGRNHADGANMLARAVKPYGGMIIWRCFVYNCQQDWRDKKTDRANAAYDTYMPLDGEFDENVILQIKNGPMDFQVREPVSPLFGGLTKTNQMLEVQAAQEYTGQQKHVCYLIPMWKEVLDFHTHCGQKQDTVADVVCGIAAVSNLGNDENWTGHDLAAANLYGFGRLCYSTTLTAEEIAREWIRMTYGLQGKQEEALLYVLMHSWEAYEKYTSPLGIGWMVNPNHHFGPNVDGYEYDRWGTYHRADCLGIGVDRTTQGTGYASRYHKENALLYEKKSTCPEELLLFFHRVEYKEQLKSGKTLIQHIYDTHFEGVEMVEHMVEVWESLKEVIPAKEFHRVKERLEFQLDHSREWRDVVNSYFYRKSGIPDEKEREIY